MCLDLSASYKGVHFVKGYQFVIFWSVQFFVLMLHLSKKFALSKSWLLLLRQLAPRASEDLALVKFWQEELEAFQTWSLVGKMKLGGEPWGKEQNTASPRKR